MSKITVTYHAPQGDNPVVEMRGVRMFDDTPVDLDSVEHAGLLGKLKTNQHFELSGEVEKIETPKPATMKASHKGFGKYSIELGDKVLVEGLAKADADQFNALDESGKTAFVESALDAA